MALHIHIGRPRKTRDRASVWRVRDDRSELEAPYSIGPWRISYNPRTSYWEANAKGSTYTERSQREIEEFARLYPKGTIGFDKARDRATVRRVRDSWQEQVKGPDGKDYLISAVEKGVGRGVYRVTLGGRVVFESNEVDNYNFAQAKESAFKFVSTRDRARKARDCSCGGTGDRKSGDAEELSYEDVTQIGPWLVAYSPRSRQWEAKSKEGTYVKSSQREILEFVRNYPDGKVGL